MKKSPIVSRMKRNPTEEEIKENERRYLSVISELNDLQEEYEKVKASLCCRYCGYPHYANGYCAACYERIRTGQSLDRRVHFDRNISKPKKEKNNLEGIYEKCMGPNFEVSRDDFMTIITHYSIDDRTKEMILSYYIDNKSYREIGRIYDLSAERVRQIINNGLFKNGQFDVKLLK